MSAKRRKKGRNTGAVGISIMVMLFLIVMVVQIARLTGKVNELKSQEDLLEQQYADETERAKELDDYEEHVNSIDYIIEMAKSKLGLVYDNEIIFKEKK